MIQNFSYVIYYHCFTRGVEMNSESEIHEKYVNGLMQISELYNAEHTSFDAHDELLDASIRDNDNYGYNQIELHAFYLEFAIRKRCSSRQFDIQYNEEHPVEERKRYRPDFVDPSTGNYIDAKLHVQSDAWSILNDAYAMKKLIEKQGYIDIIVAEGSYAPDDGTYSEYKENCAGGKSKYQLKNPHKNQRPFKASVDVKQIARYRIDKTLLESDAIKVMNQGVNSNGKDRNTKLEINLSKANPLAAIKRVENESGQPRWIECEGKFDPSLCGPREPSAYLKNQCNRLKKGMDANAQQRIMKSSQYQKQLQSKRRKNTKIIDGDTYIEVEGYITSSGKHVKTYWRRVGRRS